MSCLVTHIGWLALNGVISRLYLSWGSFCCIHTRPCTRPCRLKKVRLIGILKCAILCSTVHSWSSYIKRVDWDVQVCFPVSISENTVVIRSVSLIAYKGGRSELALDSQSRLSYLFRQHGVFSCFRSLAHHSISLLPSNVIYDRSCPYFCVFFHSQALKLCDIKVIINQIELVGLLTQVPHRCLWLQYSTFLLPFLILNLYEYLILHMRLFLTRLSTV